MNSVKDSLDVLTEERDGILFYDREGLQKMIEEEMREKGLKAGLEKGIQEGLEKGEKKANVETAKRMLDKGIYSKEQIAEITTLSIEDICNLVH